MTTAQICQHLLTFGKPGRSQTVESSSKNDDYSKIKITYLGIATIRNKQRFKILTRHFVWGPNRHTSGTILIFTNKNQFAGKYYLSDGRYLPEKLKNNKLVFTNRYKSDCDSQLVTIIDLKNGLPKNIFLKCQGEFGDLYSFSNDD